MPLQMSDEFLSFCKGLHQDFVLYGPEPRDWMLGALGFVPRDKLPDLRIFLDGLLTGGYSDDELQKIYQTTGSDLAIRESQGVREFLVQLRDILNERLVR